MHIEVLENKVSIDGQEIKYRVAEPKDFKETILIFHGWGATSFSWHNPAYSLAENGFRVIAVDLPGFGESPAPKSIWGTEEYVAYLVLFCKKLNLDKFVLLGHSFGGALATKFTVEHSEMINKLILCDAATVRKERLSFRQKTAKKMSKWGSKVASKTPFYSFLEKVAYRLAGSYDYYKANPVMREIFKEIITDDMTELSAKVKKPCLIIWGSKDMATPLEDAFTLNELIEGSYMKVINGARHNPYRTHQDQVVKIIIKFLNNQ